MNRGRSFSSRTTVSGKMSVCDCRIGQVMGKMRVAAEAGRMGRYLWDRAIAVDSPGPGDSAPLYEVVIGGWNNTQSVIRKGRQTPR